MKRASLRLRPCEIACHPLSPLRNSALSSLDGKIAQLVEQRTENPRVLGSIPSLATTFLVFSKAITEQPLRAKYGPLCLGDAGF